MTLAVERGDAQFDCRRQRDLSAPTDKTGTMPTVFRWNGYRFYFFSNEGTEPPHVHIDKADATAKIWLNPVALARVIGYSEREANILLRKVEAERDQILEAWRVHFGG